MTIQFQCDECGNQLQVPVEHAGKMASCPDCQSLTRIPGVSQDAPTRLSPSPAPPEKQPAFSANPYQSPTVSLPDSKPGFQSVEKGPLRPTAVGIDEVFHSAWQTFTAAPAILIAASAIPVILGLVNAFLAEIIFGIAAEAGEPGFAILISQGYQLVGTVFGLYLVIGEARVYLAVARGQQGDLTQIFLGFDCLLPIVVTTFIAGVVLGLGLLLLIVPGILLALYYWSYFWLIVDGKCQMFDAFSQASEIGKLNLGTGFVLGLAYVLLTIGGTCMCYLGLLLTTPIVTMMMTVAYLKMSGQDLANP